MRLNRLYTPTLGTVDVGVPQRGEQFSIVRAIIQEGARIEGAIQALESEIALIQEFRTRLIADVVTGKLDVRAAAASLPAIADLEPIDDLVEGDDLDEAIDRERGGRRLTMPVPTQPKIYHIVHVDRLASIVADGFLWSDAVMVLRQWDMVWADVIGMSNIKQRRLNLTLSCHPGLRVGDCTPFYFCSRSVMLYLIHLRNDPELTYKGGQEPIVHLEADLHCRAWAQANRRRWAFSLSNAGRPIPFSTTGSDQFDEINWDAQSRRHVSRRIKEGKQAEFLIEQAFPWHLVERIGVLFAGHRAEGLQAPCRAPRIGRGSK